MANTRTRNGYRRNYNRHRTPDRTPRPINNILNNRAKYIGRIGGRIVKGVLTLSFKNVTSFAKKVGNYLFPDKAIQDLAKQKKRYEDVIQDLKTQNHNLAKKQKRYEEVIFPTLIDTITEGNETFKKCYNMVKVLEENEKLKSQNRDLDKNLNALETFIQKTRDLTKDVMPNLAQCNSCEKNPGITETRCCDSA
eukprot:Pgem_evm1s792